MHHPTDRITFVTPVVEYWLERGTNIDENVPDLNGIPNVLVATGFFYGHGHRHISGFLNFIKNTFRIFFVRPFSSMNQTNMGIM